MNDIEPIAKFATPNQSNQSNPYRNEKEQNFVTYLRNKSPNTQYTDDIYGYVQGLKNMGPEYNNAARGGLKELLTNEPELWDVISSSTDGVKIGNLKSENLADAYSDLLMNMSPEDAQKLQKRYTRAMKRKFGYKY